MPRQAANCRSCRTLGRKSHDTMFSLFHRKQKPQPRDLERVIYDIAEKQEEADFQALYQLLRDRQVFVPVDLSTVPSGLQPGQSYTTTSADRLIMRTVAGPNGKPLACAATIQDCPLLKGSYVGMPWLGFLQMVNRLDTSIDGALLQGATSWVAFDREHVKYILARPLV